MSWYNPRESHQKPSHLLLIVRSEVQHGPLTFPPYWDKSSDLLGHHSKGTESGLCPHLLSWGSPKLPSQFFPSDIGVLVKTETHVTCYGITEFLR